MERSKSALKDSCMFKDNKQPSYKTTKVITFTTDSSAQNKLRYWSPTSQYQELILQRCFYEKKIKLKRNSSINIGETEI